MKTGKPQEKNEAAHPDTGSKPGTGHSGSQDRRKTQGKAAFKTPMKTHSSGPQGARKETRLDG